MTRDAQFDTDEVLRAYAGRWRADQPPPPDALLDLPHERLSGRRRTWPAGAAAAVVVGAVAVGSVALGHGSHSPVAAPSSGASVTVVPFRDDGQRDPSKLTPAVRSDLAPAGTPPCAAADFVLVPGSTTTSPPELRRSGRVVTRYVLRHTARSSCGMYIAGPQVALVDARGNRLRNEYPFGSGLPSQPQRLVRPGDLVQGSVTWSAAAGVTHPSAIVIAPEDAEVHRSELRIDVSQVATSAHPAVGGRSIDYGWSSTLGPIAAPGALGSLIAAIHAPARVTAGQDVSFTVDLTNATDVPVSMHDCPTYNAELDVYSDAGKRATPSNSYRGPLNCADAPAAIGPGKTVRFEFRLATNGARAGHGVLSWTLGPAATELEKYTAITIADR